MTMRISPAGLSFLALALSASSPGAPTPTAAAISAAPLDLTPVLLRGNVPPAIASGKNLGPVDRAVPMEKMILALKPSPGAQLALEALLRDQQDPKSPSYHRWLTPQQFGESFGPSTADLAKLTDWLKGQGFRIDEVTPGRNAIVFSGTAGAVMDAFRTTIAKVEVRGEVHQGNLTDPSIPAAFTNLVHGVVSLHDLPRKAMNRGARVLEPTPKGNAHMVTPHYTSASGNTYLAPGDFATIYNTKPMLASGVDGTGMTIAIAGRTDILRSDIDDFRNFFGLPPHKLAITYNGPNPGITGDETESDLDVEWAGAVAPNATVEFVTSASTSTSDGVDLSILYILNNNIAPVASVSYGAGERAIGQAGVAFFNSVYAQAAAQGQTFFISAGDAGAAGDDVGADPYANFPVDINGLGSSPNNVCVGGTQFSGDVNNAAAYWSPTNAADRSSALSYIPEAAWNESGNVAGGSGLWSTGGGISNYTLQPSWQAPLFTSTYRAVPDVSLTSADHDGYIVAQEGQLEIVAGTSAASPSFAGLLALVVQSTGQRQGNANPILYQLGNNQYKAAGPAVFHDITTGNNSVPGDTGFNAAVGYDACTGLGSVDATAMAAHWITNPASKNAVTAQIASPAAAMVAFQGSGTQTFTATGTDSNPNEILTYQWTFGDGTQATGATVTHVYATGSYTSTYPVTLTVTDSTGNLAADTRVVRVTSPNLTHTDTPTLLDALQWSIDFTTQNPQGDLNSDGVVNDLDLQILLGVL
jgi:subtilase family serine protease